MSSSSDHATKSRGRTRHRIVGAIVVKALVSFSIFGIVRVTREMPKESPKV